MRILLVTPFPPDPGAPHGGGAFVGTLAHALGRHAEIGLACLRDPTVPAPVADGAPFVWSGSVAIPSGPGGPIEKARTLWRWRHTPLVAAKATAPAMRTLLRRALTEFAPDTALVELAQMATYLPDLASIPTLLTDHEAGCPANTRTGLGPLGDARDRRLWTRFVRRLYPLASAVQALTPEDASTLEGLLGFPIGIRPPIFDVPEAPVQPGAAPPRALFFGDHRHAPNPEAARHLARVVLPRLREAEPDCELWLAGSNPEAIADLGSLDGVRVVGFAPDLRELFGSVRVLLAPLFSGAGFRVKCLAALSHGLPVVTNPLGARGLDVPAAARAVASTDEELVEATLALLRSPERAAEAGREAHRWAKNSVHPDAAARRELARLEGLGKR